MPDRQTHFPSTKGALKNKQNIYCLKCWILLPLELTLPRSLPDNNDHAKSLLCEILGVPPRLFLPPISIKMAKKGTNFGFSIGLKKEKDQARGYFTLCHRCAVVTYTCCPSVYQNLRVAFFTTLV